MKETRAKPRDVTAFLIGMSDGLVAAYTIFAPKPIRRRRNNPWAEVGKYLQDAMIKVDRSAATHEVYSVNVGQIDAAKEKDTSNAAKEKSSHLSKD